MNAKRHKVIDTMVLLGLAAGLLGGCVNKTAQDYNPLIVGQWRQIPARPENRVESVRLEHIVAFQPNAIRLDDAERNRLVRFARDGNLHLRDRIELHALPTLEGDYDPTTAARLDVLRGEFDQLGLPSGVARFVRSRRHRRPGPDRSRGAARRDHPAGLRNRAGALGGSAA